MSRPVLSTGSVQVGGVPCQRSPEAAGLLTELDAATRNVRRKRADSERERASQMEIAKVIGFNAATKGTIARLTAEIDGYVASEATIVNQVLDQASDDLQDELYPVRVDVAIKATGRALKYAETSEGAGARVALEHASGLLKAIKSAKRNRQERQTSMIQTLKTNVSLAVSVSNNRGRRDARPQGRRTGAGTRRSQSKDPDGSDGGDGDPAGVPHHQHGEAAFADEWSGLTGLQRVHQVALRELRSAEEWSVCASIFHHRGEMLGIAERWSA